LLLAKTGAPLGLVSDVASSRWDILFSFSSFDLVLLSSVQSFALPPLRFEPWLTQANFGMARLQFDCIGRREDQAQEAQDLAARGAVEAQDTELAVVDQTAAESPSLVKETMTTMMLATVLWQHLWQTWTQRRR
jgi:hypothetical protein